MLNEEGRKIGLDLRMRYVPNVSGKLVDSIVAGGVEAVIDAVHEKARYDVV